MMEKIAADALVALHLVFILFVLFGALLAWRWPRVALLHVPCAVWGVLIEWGGWICPITPLENRLRAAAGGAGYEGGFVDHYIVPVVYPPGLTRETQIALGAALLALNGAIYLALIVRRARARRGGDG